MSTMNVKLATSVVPTSCETPLYLSEQWRIEARRHEREWPDVSTMVVPRSVLIMLCRDAQRLNDLIREVHNV